jgi:4-amino-4-deoxy-L-arabinose transferase-like glycosyltransferase
MKRLLAALEASIDRRVACALLMLCAMIYIPLAGNYGMWDPWETHYGEVARQMLERNDFISQWWPGSPQDRQEFWSKPVLTFWLMAIGMKLFGLQWSHPAPPAELTDSWRVEWACRLPLILLGILGVWSVWELVRRLAGRRAGILSAIVLATSSQWLLIARQAMTDMSFVAPMTVALALAGLAVLLPEEEREKPLPRRTLTIGSRTVSWPHAPAFYAFATLFILTTLPQLLTFSFQLQLGFRVGAMNVRLIGLVPMLPYFAAFLGGLWWCARAQNRRQLYLFTAYVLCALASLAKGPAGVALPAIVLAVFLILAGRWREILTKLELPRGLVLFVATAFPWYHSMLIRHGMGFWNEFIGDNYVHRAGGRHGDRGTFDYYLQYIGYGMFPWSGVVTLGGLLSIRKLRGRDPRSQLVAFALVWFLVEFTVMSLVNTKFHHYILPALPALAILGGLLLDELLGGFGWGERLGAALVVVPLTVLCGRDLATYPARILWMFNYDYVNVPNTGRAWPLSRFYGDRYEYGGQLLAWTGLATLALVILFLLRGKEPSHSTPESSPSTSTPSTRALLGWAGGFAICLALAIASGPATPGGRAPEVARWAWLLPAVCVVPFVYLIFAVARPLFTGPRATAMLIFVAIAALWSTFLVDKFFVELSPHWSQKHVLATYYRERQGPEEPLIAWQLYWRGENFYTQNQIYRDHQPLERTVFLGDRNTEKMQTYFKTHAGRRVFFIVERTRFESLRSLLPERARSSLRVVDESNNKIYLAVASI